MALPVCVPAAQAYDFTVGGIYYNYTGDRKGAIVTYSNLTDPTYSGDIRIPAEVNYRMESLKVKQIDDRAFFNCQGVTSVTLPEGIISIGEQAFSHCYAMKSINIPGTVTRIEDYAFEFCEDMTSITLPRSLSMIGYSVFQQCGGLTEFVVEEGNPYYMAEDGILYMTDKKLLVQYPGGKPGTEFVIPESVVQMPDYAFSANHYLQKITIGPALTKVVDGTFSECRSLREFVVDEGNTDVCAIDGVLFSKDGTRLIQYPLGLREEEYIVPEGTLELADMSMAVCVVSRISLPKSLQSVGMFALADSRNVESITCNAAIPPTVGVMAFDDNILANTVLYVNEDVVDTYKRSAGWKSFRNVLAIGSSGIEAVDATPDVEVRGLTVIAEGLVEAYDATGRLVVAGNGSVTLPSKGLYIIRTQGAATKVVL